MMTVYAALLLPVLMGRDLRRRFSMVRLGGYAVLPAVTFWLTTNFAVWLLHDMYPRTATGLLACYAAAVPFFRSMVTGDLFYLAVVFGSYVLVTSHGLFRPARAKGA
jgi:hypothetical protein